MKRNNLARPKRVKKAAVLAAALAMAVPGVLLSGMSAAGAGTVHIQTKCSGTLNGAQITVDRAFDPTANAPAQVAEDENFTVTIPGGTTTLENKQAGLNVSSYEQLYTLFGVVNGTVTSVDPAPDPTINGNSTPGEAFIDGNGRVRIGTPGPIPPGTLVTPTVTFHVQPAAGSSWTGTRITAFQAGSIVHFSGATGTASATCPLNDRTLSATRVGDFPPPAGPYLSVSDPTPVVEPDKGSVKLTFTVTLVNPPPTGTVSVRYETSDEFARAKKDKVTKDAQDYSHKKGKLKFKAGTTVRTFTVTVKGDATAESDETLLVTFTEPVGAVIYGDGIVRGTILNGSD